MTSELELTALAVLKEAASAGKGGHTALPENRIIKALAKVTGKDEDDLRTALERSEVITTRVTENDVIMRASLKDNLLETQVVEHIERMITSFSKKPKFKKLLKQDINLGKTSSPSDEQISAVNAALSSAVSVITGGPGTGKTTMILGLVRAIKASKMSVTLCAPTGKAAKRLGEATGLQKFRPSTVHSYLQSVYNNSVKDFDVMIVDEASMLGISLFQTLLSTIPDGSQLILIGDKDQLPPVPPGQPFKDIIQKVERAKTSQKEINKVRIDTGINGIVSAAYAINSGKTPNSNFNLESDNFEFIECDKDNISDTILDCYFNKIPNLMGKNFDDIKDELQVLSPQRNGSAGVTNLNFLMQNILTKKGNPLHKPEKGNGPSFYASDRVIQTANDYTLGVMNGEVGDVISKNEEGLLVLFDGKEIIFDADQRDNLELAYALTIHKSQGSEYAGVIIPVSSEHTFMLSRNLLYTAVTRGKSKVCVIGEKNIFLKAIKEGFKDTRYTGLQLELEKKSEQVYISLSRLTEIYRQKST